MGVARIHAPEKRCPAFPGTGLKVVHRETLAVPREGARGGGGRAGKSRPRLRRIIHEETQPYTALVSGRYGFSIASIKTMTYGLVLDQMPAFPGAIFQIVATPVRAGCARSQARFS